MTQRDKKQGLGYVKQLMLLADADGDGKINKTAALKFLKEQINLASKSECGDEVEHLQLVYRVTEKIHKEEFNSPKARLLVPNWFIDQQLEAELKKEPEGVALLEWYDHPHDECNSMTALPYKAKEPQRRTK